MVLTEAEKNYLAGQPLGRLATLGADGFPQVKPVGLRYDETLGVIEIHGFGMETSAKYRNVQRRPQVAITVDDVVGEGMDGVRLLEIRGRAETAVDETVADGHLSAHLIRVHPHRVLSWNIEPGHPGLSARTIS